MSKCFIEGMGGGSGKLYAAISVTYPEGSVCTCSDGVKTLRAKSTSGQWIFPIPYSGRWTVTITDGKDSEFKPVEITSEGQSVSVELNYGTYLFKDGDQYTELTGGWSASGWTHGGAGGTKGTASVNNSIDLAVTATDDMWQGKAVGTANKIDLTKYSKLCVEATDIVGRGYSFSALTNKKVYYDSYEKAVLYDQTVGRAELDISALSTSYYIAVYVTDDLGTSSAKIQRIWLEE